MTKMFNGNTRIRYPLLVHSVLVKLILPGTNKIHNILFKNCKYFLLLLNLLKKIFNGISLKKLGFVRKEKLIKHFSRLEKLEKRENLANGNTGVISCR